jgi:uncharacterized LabA/DUF88 family protein
MKTYLVPNRFISAKTDIIAALSRHYFQTDLNLNNISTIGSLAGILLSISLHQPAIATLPLALHILVATEMQRRQSAKLQHSAEQHQFAVSQAQSGIDRLNDKLATLTNTPKIAPEPAKSAAHMQTSLNQIVSKLRQIQHKQGIWEVEQLPILEQKFQQQQERFDRLLLVAEMPVRQPEIEVVNPPKTAKEPIRPRTDRVAIFIDEANLYCAAKEQKITIDYAKFIALLKDTSPNCHTIAYIATDRTNDGQRSFLNALKRQGIELVTQEVIRRQDGSTKGNVDLRLGAELLVKRIHDYDTAIIVSGDADFVPVIEQSHCQGKRVEVVSFRSNTGAALIKAADSYLDLEQMIDRIRLHN